jgi:cell fate (sporulation/competence/biofilm development) regulator YlbF (YheA/YmcA/DUF963 family)
MDKIFDIAKELGEALADHPIMKKYNEARMKMESDPTAKQLIQDYETTARQLEQKAHTGRPIEPEEKRTLSTLQGKVVSNEAVKRWMEAQVEYMNLLRQVNDEVMRPVQPTEKA